MNLITGLLALIVWLASIVLGIVIAYFVIKKAVKDALKEHEQEKGSHGL